jgi:hypothetical protein
MRWWIAGLPVSRLLYVGFGMSFGYAVVGAAVMILTTRSPQGLGARFGDGGADLHAVLEMFRASLGDPMDIDGSSTAQQLLATVTSVVGVFVPAIVIGVVFIRLFSLSPFTWRKKIAICLESECDFDEYADAHAGSRDGMMTIRFYNRFTNLRIADMSCQVFLHFVAHSSDGSGTFHKITLKQLDGAGRPAAVRRWPTAEQGAPFTVWIPVGAPVEELPVRVVQGVRIDDTREAKLLVRVTAKTAGLGTDIVEEHWYRLEDAESVELGRYVPIDVDPTVPIEKWGGWSEFEGLRGPAVVPQPALAPDDTQDDTQVASEDDSDSSDGVKATGL